MTVGPSAGDASALRVAGLSKNFGGLAAVNDVDFEVSPNSITALIGPNGAGKTTIINLVSGVLRPSAGAVFTLGRDITGARPAAVAAQGIIRTFQILHIFAGMTVLDNVLCGFHLRSRGGLTSAVFRPRWMRDQEARIEEEAGAIIELVGLGGREKECAGNLPFGQQRLVEVARALAAEPRVLLLDEPASGLNPSETAQLGQLILSLRDRGLTIFFIEHDMDLVMRIAETVIVIDFGIKIAEGPPAEVQGNRTVLEAYLGTHALTEERGSA